MTLTDFDPEAEDKLLAAICYPHTHLPDDQLLAKVRTLGHDDKVALLRAYVGERGNRRHKPGRAFERVDYRFDVLADYGAFRDLQRHRMLTIEWQPLSILHGYDVPEALDEAGLRATVRRRDGALGRVVRRTARPVPRSRPGTRCRSRTASVSRCSSTRERRCTCWSCAPAPAGHPSYRAIGQEMHRLIAEEAGHRAIAESMRFVDHTTYELERLASERDAERRRAGGRA